MKSTITVKDYSGNLLCHEMQVKHCHLYLCLCPCLLLSKTIVFIWIPCASQTCCSTARRQLL